MGRKPRIEYDSAFYYVITRGNQRQKIFKDPTDPAAAAGPRLCRGNLSSRRVRDAA